MKIVCPNCSTTNDAQRKTCVSCATELQLNLSSSFQLETGQVVSILDMLDKVQQLETRLVYVEENYQPIKAEKVKEVPVEKPKVTFSVPTTLPTKIEALKALLVKVNVEKQVAKNRSDAVLFADLDFDSKKIEKRIQRLEQQKETEERIQKETAKVPVVEKVEQLTIKTYPETVEGLKKALKELEVKKELANINRDVKGLEALLVTEKELNRRIKHFELAEMYGKDDEKVEVPPVEKEAEKEVVSKVNKNLIFEIEQEIASVWSAKQRAQITQDALRFGLLADKEKALKKELAMAERGEIQARLDAPAPETEQPKTVPAKPEERKVVATNPKIIPKKKPVVKVVKPKREGPSAAEQFFAPLVSAVAFLGIVILLIAAYLIAA